MHQKMYTYIRRHKSIWLFAIILISLFWLAAAAIETRFSQQTGAATQTIPEPTTIVSGHPRLFFDRTRLAELQEQSSGSHQEIWQPIVQFADAQMGTRPPESVSADTSLEQFRIYGNQVIPLAFACVITEDTDHCDLAKRYLLTYAAWEHWADSDRRGLALAHMINGTSIAYDWLYPSLSEAERQSVASSLATWAERLYEASSTEVYNETWENWWRRSYMQNHYWTTHAALGMAGLVLLNEDERATTWLDHAVSKLTLGRDFLNGIEDGSWHESIGYQGLVLSTSLPFWVSLRHVTGVDLLPHTYLQNYPYWMLYNYLIGSTQFILAYGNFEWSWFGVQSHILRFVAHEYNNGHAEWLAQRYMDAYGRTPGYWSSPWYVFEYLVFDPELTATDPKDLPKSRVFNDLSGVIWRAGWESGDMVFALKAGTYGGRYAFDTFVNAEYPWEAPCRRSDCQFNIGHNHDDTNSFYLYRANQWLAPETIGVGREQTQYHNTILIDRQGQFRPQNDQYLQRPSEVVDSDGRLDRYASTPNFDYVSADATQRYRNIEDIEEVSRHVIFVRPHYFIMLDNLAAESPHEYTWVSHFGTSVSVDDRWIRGNAREGQILGVNVLAPERFDTYIGDDGEPFVHLQPAEETSDVRIVNLLYPTDRDGWDNRPQTQLLADTASAIAVRVYTTEEDQTGRQDDVLLVHTDEGQRTTIGPYTFEGSAAVITRNNDGTLRRIFVSNGDFLADTTIGGDLVRNLDRSTPFEASFEGEQLIIHTPITTGVSVYAPGVESVKVQDIYYTFTRSGDYVTIEESSATFLPVVMNGFVQFILNQMWSERAPAQGHD